jgi:hypothetical protein
MCFFFSLIPATICVTVGYFVLFAASKGDDGIKIFGWVLAIWLFVIAAFIPIAIVGANRRGIRAWSPDRSKRQDFSIRDHLGDRCHPVGRRRFSVASFEIISRYLMLPVNSAG